MSISAHFKCARTIYVIWDIQMVRPAIMGIERQPIWHRRSVVNYQVRLICILSHLRMGF